MNVEIGNWNRGRAIPFLGIFVPIFGSGSLQCARMRSRAGTQSVRNDLFKGLKIHDIDDPSNNVQGYLIQGLFIMAS